MKKYLLYLIAIVCCPLTVFGASYHLKVNIEPHGEYHGASLLILESDGNMTFVGENEGDVDEGKVVRIYPMCGLDGYTLKEWQEDGKPISLETQTSQWGEIYADYTMPGRDVILTAVFSNGSVKPDDPDQPDDPPLPTTFQLSVSANNNGEVGVDENKGTIGKIIHRKGHQDYTFPVDEINEFSKGDTIKIYAQQASHDWKLVEWKENEAVKALQFTYDPQWVDERKYEGYHEYVMPDYNVNLVAYFEQTILLPENPGVNQIVNGVLMLNDFKPGGLSAVANHYNLIAVTGIVVIGDLREKDLSITSRTNVTSFDLSRTYGFHTIPTTAFANDGNKLKLEHILLPTCIDSIAPAAFDCCTNLKQLTILATTPPKLSETALSAVATGLTVKVPKTALALYKDADVWKTLNIEAISDKASDLVLMLPDDYTDGRYKNMSIELVNANTNETLKYIVTENQSYAFRTLVPRTRYTAYLKSSGGQIVSTISNIFMDSENKTFTFANVRVLQDVKLTVWSPDSKDVTSDVEITWTDISGKFICKGNTVSNVLQGTTLKYSIKLSDELASKCVLPKEKKWTVGEIYNTINLSSG